MTRSRLGHTYSTWSRHQANLTKESGFERESTQEEILTTREFSPLDTRSALDQLSDSLSSTHIDYLQVDDESPFKPEVLSETSLRLDEWGVHKGAEVLAESELMQEVFKSQLPKTIESKTDQKQKKSKIEKAVADMFGAAFELHPELHEQSVDRTRHEFLTQLLDTPEYHALHVQTQLDVTASELASAAYAKQLVTLMEQRGEGGEQGGTNGGTGDGSFREEMKTLGAVSQALGEAQQGVNDLNDARQALGIGLGGGGDGSMDASQLSQTFKKVRGSQSLRRICELAGRFRRLAAAKQRTKTKHGQDDVVGVVLDGDVGRLVGSEISQITNDSTRLEALRRLIERQSMCRDYRGIEKTAKGPIMVFVDESGSMSGERSYTAKAIALAFAWIARQQKRWVCLVAFSGSDSPEKLRRIVIPPGKTNEAELLDWLTSFIGGGTTLGWLESSKMDQIFRESGAIQGKTDVVVITDGAVNFSESVQHSCNRWKALRQAKVISLVIGHGNTESLRSVSDTLHVVSDLGVEQQAVGEVLSI